MKSRFILSASIFTLASGLALTPRAEAVNTLLYWDADGATSAATGGTGTWDTTSPLWRNTTATGTLQAYDNTSPSTVTANLSGTAGTVTLASGTTINVNSLVLGTQSYVLAGTNSTSVLNFSGTAPSLVVSGNDTISVKITGTAGFTATGTSTTQNFLTGDLSGLSGTVTIGDGTTGNAARLNIQGSTSTGSQFQTWNVTANSLLTSNALTTASSTIQLGALTGAGTLRTGGAAAVDVFLIGALNTDTVFSGSIINGGAGTAITKVGSGKLTLSGAGNTYTGVTNVNGGTLVLQSSIGSPSIAVNAGTLVVQASQNGNNAISIASGAVAEYSGGFNNGGNTAFTGAGTLRKTGAGTLTWPGSVATFALGAGSLIDVQGGTFTGGSNGNEVWTNNLSGLNVATGAIFDGVEADVRFDALTGTGRIQGGYGGSGSFTIGLNDGSGTFSGTLANSGNNGGTLKLIKSGAGTQILSGANSYTNSTTITAGALNIQSNSALGTGAGNTTSGVSVTSGAALQVQGGISTTTAVGLTLNGTGVTATPNGALENVSGTNSYSGLIKLGSDATIGSDAGTLNLTNTGTITGATFGLTLSGAGNGSLSAIIGTTTGGLTKTGGGTWTLTGASTFGGATNITGGTLTVDHSGANLGALSNTSGVTVGVNSTLQVKGVTSVGPSIASSGTISLVDAATNTLTLSGGLTLNASSLNFEVGNSGATPTADQITSAGAATLSGNTVFNLSLAAGQSIITGSPVTLLSAAGGLDTGGTFSVGAKPAGFYTFTLSNSATAETLTITGNATPPIAYWTGLASRTGSPTDPANNWGYGSTLAVPKSNWSANSDGSGDTLQVPGSTTDVIFTSATASGSGGILTTKLDANYSIQSLSVAVPAGPALTSTVIDTNGNVLALGTGGLTVASGATNTSALTINGTGTVALSSSQSWANNHATRALTVSTAINGVSGTPTLTLNGTGAGGVNLSGAIGNGTATSLALIFNQTGLTTLTGANTYSGGTTISSGTVAGTTASLQGNITNNAVLIFDQTLPASPIASGTYAGVISGSGSVTKNNAGTVIFTNVNTYNGVTTINGGTLQLGDGTNNNANVGGGITLAGGALKYNYNGANFGVGNAITLTANSTIGSMGPQINLTGTFNGGGKVLTIDNGANPNYFYFNGGFGSALSQVNIVNGFAAEDGGAGTPLRTAAMVISSGAAFATFSNITVNNNITLNGGAGPNGNGVLQNEGNGTATYSGTISLNSGNSSVGTVGETLT